MSFEDKVDKVAEKITDAVFTVTARLISDEKLQKWSKEAKQVITDECLGVYGDVDEENIEGWQQELRIANKELARRNRK